MNLFLKQFLGVGLVAGLTVLGSSAQTAMNLGSRPLGFEAGGPAGTGSQFIARGTDSEFLIGPAQAQFVLRKAGGLIASCAMQFVGADASARISGGAELAGKINCLRGGNPAQWQSGVALFAQVRVEQIYPGVSVVYYGNQRQLEYDFNLAAGVNPNVIALRFGGAEKISVNPQGGLVVSLNGGEMVQHPPVAYQTVRGQRQEVAASYKILDAHTAAFSVGNYDRREPLVIDPVLSYATFFGGNYGEVAHAVALDGSGNIYIAGETLSTTFSNGIPLATAGAFQTNFHGGIINGDAFVAKFDYTGSNLVYFTYLGGTDNESALGLAVDANGNAYVTGYTESPDFPTTNALFGQIAGSPIPKLGYYPVDAFVAELNTNGSRLVYSTYLGGNAADIGNAIAVDSSGVAYVAGYTYSTNFPCTATALQKKLACTNSLYVNANAFVAAIAPGGTNLNYSSYLGGLNYDQATGIALDPAGNIYVAGFTGSTNFPTTNALAGFKHLNGSTNATGAFDVFVSKFQPNFGGLVYSTFLGGTNNDQAFGLAVDAGGNAYVVGGTVSTNFPYTTNVLTSYGTNSPSFVHTNTAGVFAYFTNAFLSQITWDGTNTHLGYSVMFGGYGNDFATAVAVAPDGNVFVTGTASSTNFPIVNVTTNTPFLHTTNSGLSDAFVIAFTNNAAQIIYSTYLGGVQSDFAYGIAVDPLDAVYVVGRTQSTNFPTLDARQNILNGTNDMFIAKISINAAVPKLVITQQSGNNFKLTWPGSSPVFSLESTTNLLATGSWTAVPQPPVFSNGTYNVTLPATNNQQFFRLRKS
jgi:hypothetical protein